MAIRTPIKPVKETPPVPRWNRRTRVAFRFCFVYFGLYSLATHIVGGLILFPNFSFPSLGTLRPMRDITAAARSACPRRPERASRSAVR